MKVIEREADRGKKEKDKKDKKAKRSEERERKERLEAASAFRSRSSIPEPKQAAIPNPIPHEAQARYATLAAEEKAATEKAAAEKKAAEPSRVKWQVKGRDSKQRHHYATPDHEADTTDKWKPTADSSGYSNSWRSASRNEICRFGTKCKRANCYFRHP